MKNLSELLSETYDKLVFDYMDNEGKFRQSNIQEHIKTNAILNQNIKELLRNESNLKFINKLIKCGSLDEILNLHLEIDQITGNHEKRVGEYAKELAKFIRGMDAKIMEYCGYVHDIGKSFIPTDILHAYNFENPRDIELITYGHCLIGETLTLNVPLLKKQPYADAVCLHHDIEKGAGYPHRNVNPLKPEVEALKVANEYDIKSPDYIEALKIADTAHAMQRGIYQLVYSDKEIFEYLIVHSNGDGKFNTIYVDAFLKSRGLDENEIKELRER